MADDGYRGPGVGASNEYDSLREEILRADDHTIDLVGFAIVAASFWAAAVTQVQDGLARSILLVGFNAVLLTLAVKVREKRGQQGRIAAYIRVFHEDGWGWESRIEQLRRWDAGRDDPSSPQPDWLDDEERLSRFQRTFPWLHEKFTGLAAFAEMMSFVVLSALSLAASALIASNPTANNLSTLFAWGTLAVQLLIFLAVCYCSRTFGKLEASSAHWGRKWGMLQDRERLQRPGPDSAGEAGGPELRL